MKKGNLIIAGLLLLLVGCQAMPYKPYARRVKMKPRVGGIVAMKVDHNEQDRAHAEKMMASNCGKRKVRILEEGEVVIGTTTSSNETRSAGRSSQKVGSLFGMAINSGGQDPSKTTNSTTTQKKEWQLKYKCS